MAQPSTSTGAIKRPCSNLKLVYNRPKPDVLNSILKSRANPRYRSRRLWYELNMPECTSTIFDGRMLSTSLPDSLLCHTREMRSKNKQKVRKKERVRTYMEMRLERENFRKKLVELITCEDDDVEIMDEDGIENFPNKNEKQMLRYYYYIKHGIDTIHVAPMGIRVLNRIKLLIRPELNRWKTEFNETINEIKADYTFAMKKAVIDFVLNNSLQGIRKDMEKPITPERKEIKIMMNRWRYRCCRNNVWCKRLRREKKGSAYGWKVNYNRIDCLGYGR